MTLADVLLCGNCAQRPVEIRSAGLCTTCNQYQLRTGNHRPVYITDRPFEFTERQKERLRAMAKSPKMTAARRKAMPASQFAIPSKDAYPIDTANRARNALARVAQNGTPAEKATVRRAVKRKYPGIKQGK